MPKQYVAGLDEHGRSTVVLVGPQPPVKTGGALSVRDIWRLEPAARALLPGRAGHLKPLDVGVATGASRAFVSTIQPDHLSGMHRTDTVDLSTVVSGAVTFQVEVTSVLLRTGDSVMVPGVLHGWHAEPAGCTLLVVMIGALPLDDR